MAFETVPEAAVPATRLVSGFSRFAAGLLLLVLIGPASAAAGQAADESTLVVDFGAEEAVVEEHSARLLWNLMTTNLAHESVSEGWNSLYLEQPEAISGEVVADFSSGTIIGSIVERWKCDGDCRTSTGAPSWTTTRNTGWTAVITDGRLEPNGDGWTITGSVKISYDATVTANETPADCGGTPCYVCANQVCKVGGTAGATVPLEGWIEGRTLSLAFADRMEPDVYGMDLSDLERTEFFMSRFSITITPPMGSTGSAGDPGSQDTATTATSSADSGVTDLPAGRIIPGVDAGAPPGPDDFDGGDDSTTSTSSVTSAAANDRGGGLSIGSIILAIALALGVGVALVLVKRLFGQKAPLEQAEAKRAAREASRAASEFFKKEATHVIEPGQVVYVVNQRLVAEARAKGKEISPGWDAPLPLSLEPIPGDPKHPEEEGPFVRALVRDGLTVVYDPENPGVAVLRSGAHVFLDDRNIAPLLSNEFTPAHQLTGDKSIEGNRAVDGIGSVEAHLPGTPVQVITTVGDRTLVRVNAKTQLWFPRSNIVETAAISATDDLGAASGAPSSPK